MTERPLSRKARVTLAQLRSGYSSKLNTFLNRINPTKYPDRNCSACSQAPHTTQHLFECPVNPTDLTPLSLWTDPVDAATLLWVRGPGGNRLNDDDAGYNNNTSYSSTTRLLVATIVSNTRRSRTPFRYSRLF